jgi:hypothetical protein
MSGGISAKDLYPIEIVSAISHPCVLKNENAAAPFSFSKTLGLLLWSPGFPEQHHAET